MRKDTKQSFEALDPQGINTYADIGSNELEKAFGLRKGKTGYYVFTSPVGDFNPNGFGLYDMCGNVWEFCWDFYDEDYYSKSPMTNPVGPTTGVCRVRRGGSWSCDERATRISVRRFDGPDTSHDTVGFRIVRTA